ncbi:unnamed protein product [Prorocentrum cordatum]|uniref:NADP-dependent oxidoreductase domain-containing protein n=1 Tax=Prorocentrum cordatum TaxID=2364126 RepID=A0ABN9TJ23_9DINO|nr:unnamed protein product [Polarella glacialis]
MGGGGVRPRWCLCPGQLREPGGSERHAGPDGRRCRRHVVPAGRRSGGWHALALAREPYRLALAFCIALCPVAHPGIRARYLRSCMNGTAARDGYTVALAPEEAAGILHLQTGYWQTDGAMDAAGNLLLSPSEVPTFVLLGSADKTSPRRRRAACGPGPRRRSCCQGGGTSCRRARPGTAAPRRSTPPTCGASCAPRSAAGLEGRAPRGLRSDSLGREWPWSAQKAREGALAPCSMFSLRGPAGFITVDGTAEIGEFFLTVHEFWGAGAQSLSREGFRLTSCIISFERAAPVPRRELLRAGAVALPAAAGGPTRARAAAAAGDLELGKLVVGAWAWGDRTFWKYDESQDADIRKGFDACVSGGVKWFDTAELYGPGRSEELLGKFIRESGADVKVATKFAAFPWKLDRSDVVKACKSSLERLGLPSVDLYQIHFPSVWRNELFWDGLADCYDQGLVKHVGVSNYGSAGLRACHSALKARGVPLATNQIQYSLVYRFPELNGMKATCDELGVKVLAYSPLGLGTLTGKASLDRLPDGPRAKIFEKLLQDPAWPGLDSTMREVARSHGPDADPAQVALAWCVAKGTVPIAGVRNARQAESDVLSTRLQLSEGEVAALDAAASKVAPYIAPEDSPFKALRVSLDTKQELYEA